jgi:cytochrome d ubiquinol oxidase subunit I
MQHPVGVEMIDGRPVMTDAWAVFTNNTALVAVPHTLFGALAVAGGFLLGIAWYHLWRRRRDGVDTVGADGKVMAGEAQDIPGRDKDDHKVWIRSLRIGAVVAMISFAGTALTGDLQGKLMFEQQPMKMAAAEAACHDGTGFSVLSIGNLGSQNCDDIVALIEVPGILSYLAKGDFTTEVQGVNSLLPQYKEAYGTHLPDNPIYGERAGQEIDYLPVMEVTYWGFRMMIGFGGIAALAALVALWLTRNGTVPESRWLMRLAVFGILAPFGANAAGWIFTEMGRQPFVVAPNPDPSGIDQVFMFTAAAVSPGVTAGELLASLVTLAAIYGVLLVVEVKLLVKYIRGGVVSAMPELVHAPVDENEDATPGQGGQGSGKPADDVLAFAY